MAEEPLSFQAFVEDELRRNPNQTPIVDPTIGSFTNQQPTGPQINRTLTYEEAMRNNISQYAKSPQEQANIDAALALGPGGVYNIPSTSIDPPLALAQEGPPELKSFEDYKMSLPVGMGSGFTFPSDEELRPQYQKYVDFYNSGAPEIPGGGLDNFEPGGVLQPILKMPPQKPIIKNPNIEAGYYDSPEYKELKNK